MIAVGARVRFVSKHDGKKYVGKVTRVQPVSGRIEISFRGPMFAIRYPSQLEVVS